MRLDRSQAEALLAGIRGLKVVVLGDLMLDATRAALERGSTFPRPEQPYLVMTLHREESTRSWDRLEPLLRALEAHKEQTRENGMTWADVMRRAEEP